MVKVLTGALRTHRWLALMGGGFVLSSIGSGLTFVIVFGELLRLHAPASSLAIAYILSSAPGLLGSKLGQKLCVNKSPFEILIIGELLGFLGLVFPVYGVTSSSVPALLMAECATAFATGMTLPAIYLIFKRGLSESEMPVATGIDTLIFSAHVFFGVGVGALLYGKLSSLALLLVDAASFLASTAFMVIASRNFRWEKDSAEIEIIAELPWCTLSTIQRRGVLLLPMLALVGSPAMALLPVLAPVTGEANQTGIALPLLFARSLGQLFGPFLIPASRFNENSRSNKLIFGCLALFLGCYMLVPYSDSAILALILIFLAHVASNVVFALAIYSVLANFEEQQVTAASAKSYRLQMIVSSMAPLGAGLLADQIGPALALYSFSGVGFVVVGALLLHNHRSPLRQKTSTTSRSSQV
ncbi:hypothetical protein [Leeia oryzae]|uniref:hypothetical protein n=1 Tax=Leeia oryzae TaxID=356662 RepID=UPI00035CD019|nr:hypothetical protein [Leeia oryzae]